MDKQTAKLCERGLGNLGYLLVLKLQGLFAELGDGMQIQEEKK